MEADTSTETLVSQRVLEVMRDFTLWEPAHYIQVHVRPVMQRPATIIGYRTQTLPIGTHFDLNIIGATCYLLQIELRDCDRGLGHGAELYQAIERIATILGCTVIEQTPSGHTATGETRSDYLARRGYQIAGGVATKHLPPL